MPVDSCVVGLDCAANKRSQGDADDGCHAEDGHGDASFSRTFPLLTESAHER